MPHLGLWVERLVHQLKTMCEPRVVAPVPYSPPVPDSWSYSGYRRIQAVERSDGVEVWHPRFLAGPGYLLHSFEAYTMYLGVIRLVKQLQREAPFDLIHAHFSYPEGAVATRLGRKYHLPVVITEHAPWNPWLKEYPLVRRQAVLASKRSTFQIAVSRYVRDTIIEFTGETDRLHVIPLGVEPSLFTPLESGQSSDPNQILFVGRLHYIKGIDVLFRAMRSLIDQRPNVRLVLIGGGFPFRDYQRQERDMRLLVRNLGLSDSVDFVGQKSPHEVAEYMRKSALLVLPSRAESFGATLVEALACGTPVVSTRCGGPEDIVNNEVGILVPKGDPASLAAGLAYVLDHQAQYDPAKLRGHTLKHFSWETISRRTMRLYGDAVHAAGKYR